MVIMVEVQVVQHAPLVKKIVFCVFFIAILGVGLIDQMAQVQNKTVSEIFDLICVMFPEPLKSECDELVSQYGPLIIEMLGSL